MIDSVVKREIVEDTQKMVYANVRTQDNIIPAGSSEVQLESKVLCGSKKRRQTTYNQNVASNNGTLLNATKRQRLEEGSMSDNISTFPSTLESTTTIENMQMPKVIQENSTNSSMFDNPPIFYVAVPKDFVQLFLQFHLSIDDDFNPRGPQTYVGNS